MCLLRVAFYEMNKPQFVSFWYICLKSIKISNGSTGTYLSIAQQSVQFRMLLVNKCSPHLSIDHSVIMLSTPPLVSSTFNFMGLKDLLNCLCYCFVVLGLSLITSRKTFKVTSGRWSHVLSYHHIIITL